MRIAVWRRMRHIVQVASLILLLGLAILTLDDALAPSRVGLLMRLDPLAGLASMLAARRWVVQFLPALVLLLSSLFLGRYWCGWLCPLGTLIDWTSSRRPPKKETPLVRWHGAKFWLLLVTLFAALWGNLTVLVLDPLTIFIRGVATAALPGVTWLVNQGETALYRFGFLRGALEVLDGVLRGPVLSYKQPYYSGALLVGGLMAGVLALNLWRRRAWCRYLCPLGAVLGLAAKASWLKRVVAVDRCTECTKCARECRMEAISPQKHYASDSGECVLCLDCAATCPREAIAFRGNWRWDGGWEYDPSRRQVAGALGASLGGLALLKIAPRQHHPYAYTLRPPGARERELLAACVRCGVCMRACPTHGLQPSLAQGGIESLCTPVLVPRLGPCDYTCTACGNLCPTGAIPRLDLAVKRTTVIGKAYIDPTLCMPWSERGDCIVCEEMCPLPEKAIILLQKTTSGPGEQRTLKAPLVVHERCVGCGLCESKCPVRGEAAIRVQLDPMS